MLGLGIGLCAGCGGRCGCAGCEELILVLVCWIWICGMRSGIVRLL
jgi:hypothetical protein